MLLSEVLTNNNILTCKSTNRWDLIEEVIEKAVENKEIIPEDKETIKDILTEREKSMSTGIGNEVAIPHCISAKINKIIALMAVNDKGIEFDAIDNKKVKIAIFLLVPQNKLSQYIKILANIAKIMNDAELRTRILRLKKVASILKIIKEYEAQKNKS